MEFLRVQSFCVKNTFFFLYLDCCLSSHKCSFLKIYSLEKPFMTSFFWASMLIQSSVLPLHLIRLPIDQFVSLTQDQDLCYIHFHFLSCDELLAFAGNRVVLVQVNRIIHFIIQVYHLRAQIFRMYNHGLEFLSVQDVLMLGMSVNAKMTV